MTRIDSSAVLARGVAAGQGLHAVAAGGTQRHWLRIGGAAALVLWVLAVRYPAFDTGITDPDESFYLLVGGAWDAGHLPYAAIWDVKPPGLFALYALIRLWFTPGLLAARVLTDVAVLSSAYLLYRLVRRHLPGEPLWLGLAAALLYPAYSTICSGMNKPTELLLAPFVIGGMSVALERRGQGQRAHPALTGLLFGCAVLIKQSAVFELALALCLLLAGRPWRAMPRIVAAFFGGAALPSLAYFLYAAAVAMPLAVAVTPFVAPLYRLSGDGISLGGGALRFLPMLKPMLPLLAAVLLLWTQRQSWRRAADASAIRRLALWLGVSAAGILAMRAMYDHYFLPLLAPLIVLSLVWLRLLGDTARGFGRVAVPAVLALMLAYPLAWYALVEGSAARPARLVQATAADLKRAGLVTGDTLYVVDEDPAIYLLTGAAWPTRFLFPQHLMCDFHLPGVDADAEIRRILAASPRFVVITHSRKWMVCERAERVAIVDAALAESYRLATTVAADGEAVDIYRRNGR